jgi:hypothetical protein
MFGSPEYTTNDKNSVSAFFDLSDIFTVRSLQRPRTGRPLQGFVLPVKVSRSLPPPSESRPVLA